MKEKIKEMFLGRHYGILLLSYICICVLVIISGVHSVRNVVSDYNREQAGMVTGLLVENINAELNNLVLQVESIANTVLTNNESDRDRFASLKQYKQESYFDSVGFFNGSNEFFGAHSEKTDLARIGIIGQALHAEDVYITDPYRSTITGRYVITIFVPVYDNDVKAGIVYANLDLGQIAVFASKNSINLPAEICMLNSKSLNYIACTDMEGVPAGSWNSFMLKRKEMKFGIPKGFEEFIKKISGGAEEGTIIFKTNEKEYTMGYSCIEKMPNWYVALQISNDELSNTFRRFRGNLYVYMSILLLLTFLYAMFVVIREFISRREFQKLSSMDPMTGAYNKRTFESLVEKYIRDNAGKNFGMLIFVDVDDFKQYNDKYGHLNGDIVLKATASKLIEEFDSIGYVGRYGGDEFVVFVKGTFKKEEISEKMREVRESLSKIKLENFGNVPVLFSSGGATCPADGMNYEELCSAADKALYQVKESGKGKFYWYQ